MNFVKWIYSAKNYHILYIFPHCRVYENQTIEEVQGTLPVYLCN